MRQMKRFINRHFSVEAIRGVYISPSYLINTSEFKACLSSSMWFTWNMTSFCLGFCGGCFPPLTSALSWLFDTEMWQSGMQVWGRRGGPSCDKHAVRCLLSGWRIVFSVEVSRKGGSTIHTHKQKRLLELLGVTSSHREPKTVVAVG